MSSLSFKNFLSCFDEFLHCQGISTNFFIHKLVIILQTIPFFGHISRKGNIFFVAFATKSIKQIIDVSCQKRNDTAVNGLGTLVKVLLHARGTVKRIDREQL